MRQVSFALVIVVSALAITGCDAGSSSVTKLLPSRGGSGTPGGSSTIEKTLPAFQTEDQLVVIFNEMNRVQRILRNLIKTPVQSANSCTKYVSTPTKRGVFLVMTYERCSYTHNLSGGRGLYAFQVNGSETYERKSSRVDVRSALTLLVGRRSSRQASMRPKASYALEASGDDGGGKTKTVEYTSTYGTEKTAGEDYWMTTVDGGRWIETGDADVLRMSRGTSFKLVYRAGANAKSSKTESVELTAANDIGFAEGCPWPISGTFDAKIGSGNQTVSVSPTGFRVDADGAELKWPTNHCLGVKQN